MRKLNFRNRQEKCVISFVDLYAKNKKNMEMLNSYVPDELELIKFIKEIVETANANGIVTASCAEAIDLSMYGIEHNCCVDRKLIEDIVGCKIKAIRIRIKEQSAAVWNSR